jgi:DNA helicase-2/ATP-dependent DNA helicase PcrA
MERHRDEYAWVFVDECQDNSCGQWIMTRFLAAKHLAVIGDDMQAIFGFRGARPDLMHAFAKSPTTKTQPLSSNFRCGQEILDAANGILGYSGERLYKGLLVCGRGTTAKVACTAAGTPEEEARLVIEAIDTAVKEGASPDDCSVLYRINAQSGLLEIEAIKRGLPYKVAGRSFFHRPEIAAAIGYLAVAADEGDADGWRACANVPSRYLGETFFSACATATAARAALRGDGLGGQGRGFWREGVQKALGVIGKVKAILATAEGISGALEHVFEAAGVRQFFREDGADEETETDVDEACAALVACAEQVGDPNKLVAYARSMNRVGREDVGEREGERMAEARVTFSTVHKAKGLEWPRVFVVGLTQGLFPFASTEGDNIEEERRLAYVAVTRARDFLSLSYAKARSDGQLTMPSQFLFEGGLLTADTAEERAVGVEIDTAEEPEFLPVEE